MIIYPLFSQLVLLVDVLKNTIHKDMMRLPTVFAAFIARAALLFFHPGHTTSTGSHDHVMWLFVFYRACNISCRGICCGS